MWAVFKFTKSLQFDFFMGLQNTSGLSLVLIHISIGLRFNPDPEISPAQLSSIVMFLFDIELLWF